MATSTVSSWRNGMEQSAGTQPLYGAHTRLESVVAAREALQLAEPSHRKTDKLKRDWMDFRVADRR